MLGGFGPGSTPSGPPPSDGGPPFPTIGQASTKLVTAIEDARVMYPALPAPEQAYDFDIPEDNEVEEEVVNYLPGL